MVSLKLFVNHTQITRQHNVIFFRRVQSEGLIDNYFISFYVIIFQYKLICKTIY